MIQTLPWNSGKMQQTTEQQLKPPLNKSLSLSHRLLGYYKLFFAE
jgi:hypothetical protein